MSDLIEQTIRYLREAAASIPAGNGIQGNAQSNNTPVPQIPQQNSNVAIGGARYPNAQTTSSAPQHSSNVAIGGARYPNAQTTSSVPQHYTTGEHSRIQTSAPVNHQTKIRSSSEVLLSK